MFIKIKIPEHIERICFDWSYDFNSEMFQLMSGCEFDPAGIIREVERRREEVKKSIVADEKKEVYYKELNTLKRYVMNMVIHEEQHGND